MKVDSKRPLNGKSSVGYKHTVVKLGSRERGKSLLELVIVIAIMGVIASVALPSNQPTKDSELSLASTVIADAIRFARESAKLSSVFVGLEIDASNQRIRLFRIDQVAAPTVKVFDVIHPISKQPYIVTMASRPFTSIKLVGTDSITTTACTDSSSFLFDQHGIVRCSAPAFSHFEKSSIRFELDGYQQQIDVDGYTGRVYEP